MPKPAYERHTKNMRRAAFLKIPQSSSVEEGDTRGCAAPKTGNFLEIKVNKNHYSVVKGYFRFKKLL